MQDTIKKDLIEVPRTLLWTGLLDTGTTLRQAFTHIWHGSSSFHLIPPHQPWKKSKMNVLINHSQNWVTLDWPSIGIWFIIHKILSSQGNADSDVDNRVHIYSRTN